MQYRTPGVYVEEISGGSRPVEAVGTSTLGIVGVAENPDAYVNQAIPVTGPQDYRRKFGRPEGEEGPSTNLGCGVNGFFQNGGRLCYVVNVGLVDGPVPGDAGSGEGIDCLDLVDDVAIVAAPGFIDPISFDRMLAHCERRKDRVAVLDGPANFSDPGELIRVGTVAAPPSRKRRAAAEGEEEPPPPPEPSAEVGYKARDSERGFGAQYGPQGIISDPLTGERIIAPLSGHIAGVWARTDAERGVHKAPANTNIVGLHGPSQVISAAVQELLNPKGFNVIRTFPGRGHLIWGARTVADDAEWRYVNVRRLFSMIEESLMQAMQWAVYEPNDQKLWESLRRDITAFLTRLWRDGALLGTTPTEAFYVRCDADTNPAEVRDAGQVVVEIGIAPVKPAEFVIIRISQHQSGASVEEGAS